MSSSQSSAVGPEQQHSWTHFLKTLASFSGDLSSLTAPAFILSPHSLLEFSAYWGEHPDVMAAISEANDPAVRMLNVLRFYVSTLRGSYTARNSEQGSEKKPFNPILGEVYLGKWPTEASKGKGETILVSEQVSHHPPVSAYYLENQQAGVSVEGHNGQSTHFVRGTVTVKQVGHTIIRATPPSGEMEVYMLTLPRLAVEGIWLAKPYVELANTKTTISSTSGYLATLEFSGKGWVSGARHQIKATVATVQEPEKVLYTIQGDWSGQTRFVGPSPSGASDELFWDADAAARVPITVKPLEEQAENESLRLWHGAAQGLLTSNYDQTSREKSRIENEQRHKRKLEGEGELPAHEPEYFTLIEDDPEYAILASYAHHEPEEEHSWRHVKGPFPV